MSARQEKNVAEKQNGHGSCLQRQSEGLQQGLAGEEPELLAGLPPEASRVCGKEPVVAKMDASEENATVKTGTYWLIAVERVAKMDAFTCKILLIPAT